MDAVRARSPFRILVLVLVLLLELVLDSTASLHAQCVRAALSSRRGSSYCSPGFRVLRSSQSEGGSRSRNPTTPIKSKRQRFTPLPFFYPVKRLPARSSASRETAASPFPSPAIGNSLSHQKPSALLQPPSLALRRVLHSLSEGESLRQERRRSGRPTPSALLQLRYAHPQLKSPEGCLNHSRACQTTDPAPSLASLP